MNIVIIVKNELKLMLRNKFNLLLLMIMPIAMIAIMGYALKPFLNIEEKGIEKFSVLYENNDNGLIGRSFDSFIKGEGNKYFNLIKPDSKDAEGELLEKNMDEAIIVPEDLTEKVLRGEKADIVHVSSGEDVIKDSVTRSFLEAFRDNTNNSLGIENILNYYGIKNADAAQIQTHAANKYGTSFVNIKDSDESKRKKLDSFQYFSASMLIFFLLTSGMGLGIGIINERSDRISSRISSFPVTNSQYLIGKTLGNAVIGISQAVLVIIFSSLVFKVDWGKNYLGLSVVILPVIFISSGLAVILSTQLKSSKALSTILTVIFWIMTFISGAFTPVPAFESAARFTVNNWAFESITGFMTGEGIGNSVVYIIMLVSLCLIIWIAGIGLYGRRLSNE